MKYKMNIKDNVKTKSNDIKKKYGEDVNIVISSSHRNRAYTIGEIEKIIKLKNKKFTDQMIADDLGRTYWSIVYKLSELRKVNLT